MKSTVAERLFSALVYCQALLVFAGVASVLLRDRSDADDTARHVEIRASSNVQASL